ncbi:MAG: choice-of-anchor Q domain-containing protein, partial [Acidobacteriota bacterium]
MFQRFSYLRSLGWGFALAAVLTLGIAASSIAVERSFGPLETVSRLILSGGTYSKSINAPSATATIGSGGTYPTVKAAFDDINAGAGGLTGSIQLDLIGNTTESSTAELAASGTGGASYSSVLIRPSGGIARTVSGSLPAGSPLIDLNGADHVTIDGLNAGGNSLTISNTTSSAVPGTSTIRFRSGATSNTVTNATILGSFAGSVGTDGGNVYLGLDNSTASGNDNNTISNNDIGPAGLNLPTKGVYVSGSTLSTAVNNSGNVVDNNNIFDCFGPAVSSAGIYVAAGSTDDSFTNNRFYQTSARTLTTGDQHSAIWIANGSGNNFQVAGNTIGFASAAGTGVYDFVAADPGAAFVPIYLQVGTATATSVEGNTVAGIAMSGVASGTGAAAPLRLIYVNAGLTMIGDATANTIGSQSAPDSITYTSSAASSSDLIGISNFGNSNWITNNNNIGGLSASNSSTGAANIYGFWANTGPAASWTAQGNTVGGPDPDSISSTSTAAGTIVQGMVNSNAAGALSGNIIRNLSAAGGNGTLASSSVVGIVVSATGANQLISRNAISDLINSNASASTVVSGIQFNGSSGANTVERNLVSGLTSATSSTSAEVNGIRIAGGNTTYRNNFIIVGAGVPKSIGTAAAAGISGINEPSGTNNFYHNSIYVGGSPTAGAGASIAFNSTQTTAARVFRNNIFVNGRTNTGTATGKNYAIRVGGTTANPAGLTIDNNIYFTSGAGTVFGLFNSIDVADLAAWKIAVGQDVNSLSTDPLFVSPTDLHLTSGSPARNVGASSLGVVNDFDNKSRPGGNLLFDIGASEFDGTLPPANEMQASAFVDPISGGTITAGEPFLPKVTFLNNGTSAQTNVTVRYRICTDTNCTTVLYDQTAIIASVAPLASQTVSFPSASVASAGNYWIKARSELATDTDTANDEISGTLIVVGPLSGPYTIGAAGTYSTLTQALSDLESFGVDGPVTMTLTDAAYNTGETFPIVIGVIPGASAANSITIKPATGVTTAITGSSSTCLLTLSGADYVTFDGSNNGTSTRDLTLTNTDPGTNSAVLCLQSTASNDGASNDTFKNINIAGSGNAQTLFGIFSGANGTPSISSLGTGNSSNTVQNNNICKVQYGIYSQGASSAVKNSGNVISQNLINAISPNNVSKGGIIAGFENNLQVTQNNIGNIAQSGSPDVYGISLGIQSLTTATSAGNDVTNATVSRNIIGSIRNTGTFSACGICIAPALSGITKITNNVISGVSANGTASHLSTGIFAGGGTGSTTQIYFNSVSMTGTQTGGNGKSYGIAVAGGDPIVDIRNNAVVNTQNNGSGSNYAIGSGSTTFANMSSNFNDLFAAIDASHFVGSTSSLSAPVNQANLANWSAATGKDTPNSLSGDPQFLSATDLHPQSISPILSAGTPISGITTDIAGVVRNVTAPSIGAYESGVDTLGPTITYSPLASTTSTANRTLSISVTDQSGVPTSGTGLPRVYFRKGNSDAFTAFSQCTFVAGITYNCVINYAFVTGGGVVTGDTLQYFVVAQDSVGNVSASPSAGAGGLTPNPPTAATQPTAPNTYFIAAAVSGPITVGSSQTFTSLTRNDAGGLFRYLNSNVVTGDITINITSDLLLEDGSIALNEFPSPYVMTIRPSGAPRVIAGTSVGATALIKLNGADRVTITGSVDGAGTDRSLTISNSNVDGAVLWIASAGAADPAKDNTIQYCNISGSGPTGTIAGLLAGGGVFGDPSDAANDNNTFRGNVVTKVQNGAYVNGKTSGGDNNWLITGNTFGSATATDKLGFRGVYIANTAQASILQNTISGVVSSPSSTSAMSGIMISGLSSGGEISRNQISDIKQMNPVGLGSNGLYLASATAASNLLISNNFISDIASRGAAGVTAADNGYGIAVGSGGGYRIFNNTVSLSTDQASASSVTAALNIGSGSAAGSIDLRNNILSNSQTIGSRYAIYVSSAAGAAAFSAIDWNDYFAQNVGFLGAARVSLANWQAASGSDAASKASDPQFVSVTDLHLLQASTMVDAGTSIAAVTTDIDGDARPTFAGYDIGADEYVDKVPPDTTIDTKPSDPSTISSATFTFSGTDAGGSGISGFDCKLDAGTFANCTSPVTYSGLSQGSHTFSVRAKDAAGNIDPSPATYSWVVDAIPPDTLLLTTPQNPSNSTTATFTFSGSDSVIATVAGFECKLDAAAFAACTSPQTYNLLSQGSHTFEVRTVDGAGNKDPSPASFGWIIDSIAPDTQILTHPTDPSNSTSANFTFSGTDTGGTGVASFECKLDGAAF